MATSLFGDLIDPYSKLDRDHKIIFVHIPKTAGNSITRALFDAESYGHYPVKKYLEFDSQLFENSFKFSIVRNPWDRLVSAYFYLKKGGIGKYDNEFSKRHLTNFRSFSEFVEGLSDPKINNVLLRWTHFKPQSDYILDNDGVNRMDYIGKFENLNRDFAIIKDKLGITEARLCKINQSNHKKYTEYYASKKMIDTVGDIYKMDIELFGYTFGD